MEGKPSDTAKDSQKDLRFGGTQESGAIMVLIKWLFAGQRREETVPLKKARHRRNELESQGAVIYWTERVLTY